MTPGLDAELLKENFSSLECSVEIVNIPMLPSSGNKLGLSYPASVIDADSATQLW